MNTVKTSLENENQPFCLGAVSGSLLLQAKELFAKLTDDERMDVLSDYCTYCGQNEKELGKCHCAPCYDE
jgi:hypothetical protein